MSTADCGFIVFLRLPEKGKVKTRIAGTLGEDAALAIYKELTATTLELASKLEIPVYLFYKGGMVEERSGTLFHYLEQAEGDLGIKIESAINSILLHHKKVIISGSDCPDLSLSDINEAIHHLEDNDFVIGPATDGGFYLMGCKSLFPSMFENIPWSTGEVLPEIIRRLKRQEKSYCLLRTLHDIDVEEDWIRYKRSVG